MKTVQFGNPSQDTVDPRDGGFGGRLSRWKWEKWIKAIYWGVNGSWIENQYAWDSDLEIIKIAKFGHCWTNYSYKPNL